MNGAAEPGHPDSLVYRDKYVSGFEIAVQQSLAVEFAHRVGQPDRQVESGSKVKRVSNAPGQQFAARVLEHEHHVFLVRNQLNREHSPRRIKIAGQGIFVFGLPETAYRRLSWYQCK